MKIILRLLFNILVTGLLVATMLWVAQSVVLVMVENLMPPEPGARRLAALALVALLAGVAPGFAIARVYKAPSFYLGAAAGALFMYPDHLLVALSALVGVVAGHLLGVRVQRKLNPEPKQRPPSKPDADLS